MIYLGQHLVASSCCLRPFAYSHQRIRIMGRKGVKAWRSGIVRRIRRGGTQVPEWWLGPLPDTADLVTSIPEQFRDRIKIDTPEKVPHKVDLGQKNYQNRQTDVISSEGSGSCLVFRYQARTIVIVVHRSIRAKMT
jgi:hypothetical protein